MPRWRSFGPFALAVLGACSDGTRDAPPSGDGCGQGFAREPHGGCRPAVPDACPAGTMPEWGFSDCRPVGMATCPASFRRDASGWGCAEPSGPSPCEGTTRVDFASGACVPIGRCDAPFPPPEATIFVDDDGGPGVYTSIGEASLAAPEGSTIAVAAGTYEGTIQISKRLTIAGECAEHVVATSAGGPKAGLVITAKGVVVRGMRVTNFPGGALVEGGEATFEEVLFDANRTAGIEVRAGGVFYKNGVAIYAQQGSTLTESDGTQPLGEGEVRVSTSTKFVENGARTGAGLVPVPAAIE